VTVRHHTKAKSNGRGTVSTGQRPDLALLVISEVLSPSLKTGGEPWRVRRRGEGSDTTAMRGHAGIKPPREPVALLIEKRSDIEFVFGAGFLPGIFFLRFIQERLVNKIHNRLPR